jgi:outer membrane PBP1 activator LpoA protein
MTPTRLPLSMLMLALAIAACATPQGSYRAHASVAAGPDAAFAAAETALAGGRPDEARAVIAGAGAASLDTAQRVRLVLIQAEIALAEDRPVEALQALPAAGDVPDPALAIRAEGDRAQALFRTGDAIGAAQALVQREHLMTDPAQRNANHELLWNSLRAGDLDTASGSRLAQADKVARGWIELAVISRSVWLNPHDLDARLAQWRAEYPGHPAQERLDAMPQLAPAPRKQLDALALLLPLSGPHAAGAEAVRDGFFSAFFEAQNGPDRPVVRLYDSGATPDAVFAAYRSALDDGAQFIVGPLKREDVAALAAHGRPDVPVLALNYLDPGRGAPFNFFQWGLAPEDEARQVAERAIADHQYRAVAMVPEGEWGERVLRAFRERLETLGGALVAAQSYAPADRDHSDAIRALLGLDASEERHRALTIALGIQTGFEPRRREDIDLAFIAARPEQARQIGPQFRFYRAGDLPIYATSLIYDGDAPPSDLNGLRFCDMPWMFASDGNWAALRNELKAQFPGRPRDYTRLLALGHDAYTLVRLIDNGQLAPGSFFPAASGTLSLRDDRVITRGLACAEIRNGVLKPLDVSLTR